MTNSRSRKRSHIEVSISEDDHTEEITSKYFKRVSLVKKLEDEPLVPPVEEKVIDIAWIKSLNSKEYFKWISEMTDDNPERWNKPLDHKIFVDRPFGSPPLPENFIPIYTRVRLMRSKIITPVDSVGCAALPITVSAKCDIKQDDIAPKNYRLQLLVALMLSAQTKDELNAQAMLNLIRYCIEELRIPQGLTLEALLQIDENILVNLIKMVGFHNKKAHYIKQTAQVLLEQFESDIPTDLLGILSLPGVGPKMGLLALQKAWGKMDGIGVDVHVHRLCKMWGWVDAKKCKTADHTRKELESWLPRALWYEINPLLVGFGQVICMSRGKRCDLCLASDVCNAVDQKLLNKGKTKKPSRTKAIRGDFSQWLEYLANEDKSFDLVKKNKNDDEEEPSSSEDIVLVKPEDPNDF